MNARIVIRIATGDQVTLMEQEFLGEIVESTSIAGDVVAREERPNLMSVTQSLATDAVIAHRRFS